MDFGEFAENWKNCSKIIFSDFLQDLWREKMDFGKFAEKWKNRPKIIFSDFLKDFWREKMEFWKFDENWKNRLKIIFSDFLQYFWREKIDFGKFWWKVKKSPKNHFFRTYCRISEGKNRLWWQLKRSPKNLFSDFLQDFWNEKVDFKQCNYWKMNNFVKRSLSCNIFKGWESKIHLENL